MDGGVFINYRGEDSQSYGALLYTELARQFGEQHVFLDCESIPTEANFLEELLDRVRSARVLLAVIGPHWLTATDPAGWRRIDDPADWIRSELAEAFAAGIRVIPVLTEQVTMPAVADLPADIVALSRCQYRRLRHHDPTADLARIVADLTSLYPKLAASARSRDDVPRQLPAAPSLFTGRATELAALTDAATMTPRVGATVVISAIGGAGGIGKTALALHWAHANLHQFPDGQLYVNLRGFDPSGHPTPAGEAVRGFLDGLGVDPSALPVALDAQAARYRSLVAGKRMLIVLDNAHDIDQLTPVLPGSPTCTVLVTSRHHLAGLTTLHGASLLDLDILPEPEAHDLLAGHLGSERLAVEPQAVAELLAICAGLPLAVAVVAARAVHHPDFPLTVLAEELRDISARLDGLDAGDIHTNVRAVLSWSARTLSKQAAAAFGLMGVAPGPDISLPAAASLTALSTGQARAVLRELENASLIQQHTPGRYRMHDLVRLYATDTAHHDLTEEVREAALRRIMDFYLHTTHTADRLLNPHNLPLQLDPPAHAVRLSRLANVPAALAWLDTEHTNLIAAQQTATTHQRHRIAWQLARTLETFHFRQGHRQDNLAVWRAALDAAEHLSDLTALSLAHRRLGEAYSRLERHEDAMEHLYQALELAKRHCNLTEQAHTHNRLASAWGRRGDHRQELEHAESALDLYRTVGMPIGEASALNGVGWCLAHLGDYRTARARCQAALALNRRHHYVEGEANTLDSLGFIDHHTGRHRRAIDHYQQALTLLRDHGDTSATAVTLDGLGHPHAALGQVEEARAVWQEAKKLYREQGRDTHAARVQRQLDNLDAAAHSRE